MAEFTVFGRTHGGAHPLAATLASMSNSADIDLRAISRNLIHDHRISDARDASLRRLGGATWTVASLQRALVRYQYEKVKTRRLPEFVYKTFNRLNIVSGDERLPRFDRNVRLVRVLDLNGLMTVYQWARANHIEPFASWLPWPVSDDQLAQILDGALNGAPPDDVEAFIRASLEALNSYGMCHPYQPVWCTTWEDFASFIDEGADRWNEVLGVASRGIGRWILLLTYRVRDAGTLIRPTQLDVGWDARGHFPSPPEAPVWRGGHPMDLAGRSTLRRLLPEYIHRQVPHCMDQWIAGGRRLGVTKRAQRATLADARRAHYNLLVLHYGESAVHNWMDQPI
ncbi:MAG TPA: hypothetical protein VGQ36_20900 [Thermoanaerobaculia bacterium]|jgi:hypothetical protein|nr:hypothetical protein [Thermoanaerobaculia bacterium]